MTTRELAKWAHQGMDMDEVVALIDAHVREELERAAERALEWLWIACAVDGELAKQLRAAILGERSEG